MKPYEPPAARSAPQLYDAFLFGFEKGCEQTAMRFGEAAVETRRQTRYRMAVERAKLKKQFRRRRR